MKTVRIAILAVSTLALASCTVDSQGKTRFDPQTFGAVVGAVGEGIESYNRSRVVTHPATGTIPSYTEEILMDDTDTLYHEGKRIPGRPR